MLFDLGLQQRILLLAALAEDDYENGTRYRSRPHSKGVAS